MGTTKEYRRLTENAKDKVNREVTGVTEILRCIAEEAGDQVRREIEKAREILKSVVEETRGEGNKETARSENRGGKGAATAVEFTTEPGSVVCQDFEVSDFTNVEVDCAFLFEINRADTYGVTITANEKLFDYINVAKSGNTLRLSLNPIRFHTRPTLKANITMPAISKLRQSAATRGTVRGFHSSEPFDLNLSGASVLDIEIEAGDVRVEIAGASRLNGNIKVHDAEITLSGASHTELTGSANNVVLNGWGATTLNLTSFVINNALVYLKGASHATVNVTGQLEVDLSGASRLRYLGQPNLREINVSGASTLTRR